MAKLDDVNFNFDDESTAPGGSESPAGVRHSQGARAASSDRDAIRGNVELEELFDRVQNLLGDARGSDQNFIPPIPENLEQTKLNSDEVERLVLKFLLQKGCGIHLLYGMLQE